MPDLSQWQRDYETAPAERDKSQTEVPDGKYQVRVTRVELKDSKQGNPMLEWELDILGPRHAHRKLWRRNMLTSSENIKFLKSDLYTCGVTLTLVNDLNNEPTLRALIGVTLEVTKKTKGDFENVYFDKRIELGAPTPRATGSRTATQAAPRPPIAEDDIPF
jgi:hypothetical protein